MQLKLEVMLLNTECLVDIIRGGYRGGRAGRAPP